LLRAQIPCYGYNLGEKTEPPEKEWPTVKKLLSSLSILIFLLTGILLALSPAAAAENTLLLAQQDQQAKDSEKDEYDEYDDDDDVVTVADPLEPFNREMYIFNDVIYFLVLEPTARGYKTVVPWEFRTSIKNFFHNIRFPVRFINSVLQAKWGKAGDEFAQFFLNSTVGFLGIADVGSHYPGLKTSPEDTGQSFAVWGAGEGFFLTLPFLGPTTLRDGVGMVGDTVMDPLFWLIDDRAVSIGVKAGEIVNATSFRLGDYEAIKEASLDPYVAIRNGFIQNRNKLIGE
jgi:phospholipid-binding lipoprotein MlaA